MILMSWTRMYGLLSTEPASELNTFPFSWRMLVMLLPSTLVQCNVIRVAFSLYAYVSVMLRNVNLLRL